MIIPKIQRVLHCTNAETAFVQNDYPYGRQLRCKRRNWLEFKPGKSGGFRYVHQTSDPKASAGVERWNKPKLGTYTFLAVLVVTDEHCENGEPSAVSAFGLGLNDSEDALEAFMAAFGTDLDENQKSQAELLKKLIPRYGSKKTGRMFRVRDAETGLQLFPCELVTAGHEVFATSLPTSTGDLSLLRRDGANQHTVEIDVNVLESLKKYNPPLQSIDEHRKFGLVDNYGLGKRLLIEYVPDAAVEGAAKLSRKGLIEAARNTVPEVPLSRRRTDEAWPLKTVPDAPDSEPCHIDPDQAASPFSDD